MPKPKQQSNTAVEDTPQQATEETAVTVASETALASFGDLEQDGEKYVDNFAREDFAIPFLMVLQSNSPQTLEGHAKSVVGAKQGSFFLTSNNDLFDGKKGIVLVPVTFERKFIAWGLRENGGGFKKSYDVAVGTQLLAKCSQDEKGRFIIPNEDKSAKPVQLVETLQYLVLIATDEGPKVAIFALTSTQLKKGRKWNVAIDGLRLQGSKGKFRPPMFAMSYTVTTKLETNEKGNWSGVDIVPHKLVTEMGTQGQELYATASKLRDGIQSGAINTDVQPPSEDETSGTDFKFD